MSRFGLRDLGTQVLTEGREREVGGRALESANTRRVRLWHNLRGRVAGRSVGEVVDRQAVLSRAMGTSESRVAP